MTVNAKMEINGFLQQISFEPTGKRVISGGGYQLYDAQGRTVDKINGLPLFPLGITAQELTTDRKFSVFFTSTENKLYFFEE